MSRFKILVSALLAVLISLGFQPAMAETDERINLFDIVLSIQPDGDLVVTERIVYNFGSEQRHGIFRFIPSEDALPGGSARVYDIELMGVVLNGEPVFSEEYFEGSNKVIKIGDPEIFVTGSQIYTIQYRLSGALHPLTEEEATALAVAPGDIELYWDVIGDGWDVPIDNVFINLQSPVEPLGLTCFPAASRECLVDGFSIEATNLNQNEALTISLLMPESGFTSPIVENIRPPWSESFRSTITIGLVIALLVFGLFVYLISRVRQTIKSFPVRDFVRFEIPQKLKPAEIAVALDGRFEAKDLTATLLDLGSRGFVKLEVVKSKISLTKLRDFVGVTAWELDLLQTIFKKSNQVDLSSYDAKLEKSVNRAKETLLNDAETSGRRPENLLNKKRIFLITLVVSLLLLVPGFIGFAFGTLAGLIWPTIVVGILMSAIGYWSTPVQHTETSAEFTSAALGLRKALDTESAEMRREFAHKSGLDSTKVFVTLLPFAVIFGLEKAWVAAHPEIAAASLATYGVYVADMNNFDDSISSIVSGFSSSMTSPSSSSGGGSSGGGGGGGGGGSW
jgi:uncharacterized membrane protein YgcG